MSEYSNQPILVYCELPSRAANCVLFVNVFSNMPPRKNTACNSARELSLRKAGLA